MQERIEKWLEVLEDAYVLTYDLDKGLRPIRNDDIIKKTFNAYLFKTNRTLAGIILLYKNGFQEEGQILVRTIFELHLDFSFFVSLVKSDPETAARRVVDSIIIEKAKQLKASNFDVIPENIKIDVQQWETEVTSRYPKADLVKLRKYGFSMISIEERAKRTGNAGHYNVVYRNFSRNTHNNDFMESFLQIRAYEAEGFEGLKEAREDIAMRTTFSTVCNILEFLNSVFDFSYNTRIEELRKRVDAIPKIGD